MMQTEQDWEAECDARTLADAETIKADKVRLGKAKSAAERLAKEAQEKAEALKKISDPKTWFPNTKFPKEE